MFSIRVTDITTAGALVAAGIVAAMPASEARAAANINPGVTYRYVDTLTYGPGTPGNVQPRSSQTDYFTISLKDGASFRGRHGLVDEHIAYSQTVDSPPDLAVDQFIGFTTAGGITQTRTYGYQAVSSTPTEARTDVETIPDGSVEGEAPERAGQTWSPLADYTESSSVIGRAGLNGETSTAFGHAGADGSYAGAFRIRIKARSERFAWDADQTLHSDGSGAVSTDETGYDPGKTVFGLPVRSGQGFVIPVTSEGGNAQPGPPSPKKTVDVPDWFPGGAQAPRPLASTLDVDTGETRTPAACGVRGGLQAYDIHETSTALDPTEGLYSVQTSDQYDSPTLGTVCTISYWNTYEYDNYSTGTGSFYPEIDTTILLSETGPQSVNLVQAARLRRTSNVAAGKAVSKFRTLFPGLLGSAL